MKTLTYFLLAIGILGCSRSGSGDRTDLDAQVVVTYSDGTPRMISYFDKDSHEKVSEVEYYADKKTFREWSFASGKKNGEARSYREDGTLWSLHTYKENVLDGPYKTWHENGAIYIDGAYSGGERTGLWKFYSPEGRLIREHDFSASEPTYKP